MQLLFLTSCNLISFRTSWNSVVASVDRRNSRKTYGDLSYKRSRWCCLFLFRMVLNKFFPSKVRMLVIPIEQRLNGLHSQTQCLGISLHARLTNGHQISEDSKGRNRMHSLYDPSGVVRQVRGLVVCFQQSVSKSLRNGLASFGDKLFQSLLQFGHISIDAVLIPKAIRLSLSSTAKSCRITHGEVIDDVQGIVRLYCLSE